MVSHEPFWDDEFVLLVHPQFAIYDIGQGQYTDVYYGAEPVTATIPVASLDACARGIPSPYQGQDPCSASYSDTTLIAPASGVVYRGSANTVELTAGEASSLLKLDPFYEGGQGADLPPTRGIGDKAGAVRELLRLRRETVHSDAYIYQHPGLIDYGG